MGCPAEVSSWEYHSIPIAVCFMQVDVSTILHHLRCDNDTVQVEADGSGDVIPMCSSILRVKHHRDCADVCVGVSFGAAFQSGGEYTGHVNHGICVIREVYSGSVLCIDCLVDIFGDIQGGYCEDGQ